MSALIQDLLESIGVRLSPLSDTPQLDAQVVMAHIMGEPRTWVLSHPISALDNRQVAKLDGLIQRLELGEPLPYVLGHWEFFGLDFDITPDVLIPRPETELLAERAIAWLQASPERRTVADLGTGSGCIAIALAMHVPGIQVLATDISLSALRIARHNAIKFRVAHHIDFVQCDLIPPHIDSFPTNRHFDMICANLPYIPTGKLHNLPIYGREPTLALDGGEDGLDPFRKLFKSVPDWMASDGRILLEIEATRGLAVLSLAYDTFSSASIHLHQDLTGDDRLLEIQLSAR
jgi:release factor glutamine methyltransferase